MKKNQWMIILGISLAAFIRTQAHVNAQDAVDMQKAAVHRNATQAKRIPDRMSRHEEHLVQKRLSAIHRAEAKKFDRRAFDRDFERMSERFDRDPIVRGGVQSVATQPSTVPVEDRSDRNYRASSQGQRVIRDSITGQFYLVP